MTEARPNRNALANALIGLGSLLLAVLALLFALGYLWIPGTDRTMAAFFDCAALAVVALGVHLILLISPHYRSRASAWICVGWVVVAVALLMNSR